MSSTAASATSGSDDPDRRDHAATGSGDRDTILLQQLAVLFGLGLLGVGALVATTYVQYRGRANLPFSPEILALLSALVPTILLAVAVVLGTVLAPRVGFRSHVADRVETGSRVLPKLAGEWRVAVAVGGGLGVVVILLDFGFQSVFGSITTTSTVSPDAALLALAGSIPLRVLYGGITEELLLRWGFMSLAVWLLWKLAGVVGAVGRRGRDTGGGGDGPSAPTAPAPTSAVVWAGILIAAVAFGLGHLPTLFALGPASFPVVGRTILLNAILGTGFGWLFWRRSLEAAMLGHVAFHALIVPVSAVVILVG
ncbi:CPBP family intramembrane glutamic endopeptidase [Salinirubrum litoreum]|uniref:Type II CAAX prenyl endopeptidase Rce1 family protein n=1 Tax=Salinirubrum litoreum TaxID=1126234 RepID=A0ABD5RER6_9EURY|nr:CPBP family intramembrane glutamic endopeptidase [Salinirubrum litoreum]